ncbi:MAG: DUF5906 domain-containing protein [Bryobacteraceae bacterium]
MKDDLDRYFKLGWRLVPIPKGEKGPRVSDWQHCEFLLADFDLTANVGVLLGEPSKWETDIDCDCKEAVAAAKALLLKTKMVHGRPSNPASHYHFTSEGSKSEAFKDINGSMLVEIRSTGGQTVLPPSVHPSGEKLAWEVFREASVVEFKLLRQSVAWVATAALLARHWPSAGSRHAVAGLAAGLLVSLKLEPLVVEKIIEAAATIAGDNDVADRTRFARETIKTFVDGGKVAGGPKLSDEMGPEIVKRIREWFEDTTGKSQLDLLNEKHAIVFQQSGDLFVITEDRDVDGNAFLRFSSPEVIKQLYPQLVPFPAGKGGKTVLRPLGATWLVSPRRRFYNGIELAPNGRGTPGYYNMWNGFTVEPKKGDWSLYRQHLELLAEHDDVSARYILAWMADVVKHPERPGVTSLGFRGGQGTGKSTFVKWYGALFGSHFLHLDSEQRLLGRFNAHLHNAILVLADEAVWAGGKQGLGALKRLITEDTLAIERKGIDTIMVKNMIHMMVASNEDWFVPASFDDRRFAVFHVSDAEQNNASFFGAVHAELFQRGGLAALLYDLLEHPGDVDLRLIPETEERDRQKKRSLQPKHAWWLEMLTDGSPWDGAEVTELGDYLIDNEALYTSYITATQKAERYVNNGFKGALGRYLKTVLPDPYPVLKQAGAGDERGKRCWLFPSLEVARQHYDKLFGKEDWGGSELHLDSEPSDVPF